jgi:hypothetical protein
MATLVLAAAGAALGGQAAGALGAAGAIAGRALGGLIGGIVDQRLLGGSAAVEGPRLDGVRVMGSREGAPVARVYGRMRVAGQVIWAARFRETASTSGGGKGRPRVRSYAYSLSFAVGLCEGAVERIGRVWADGNLVDRAQVAIRLHRGTEDQAPDPLIEAVEGAGNAPAYRGLAYVVFEDLPLGPYGDRVPQVAVEVFRQPKADPALSAEIAPPLSEMVRAVALSPGSGEFALETRAVRRRLGPGRSVSENVNNAEGRADALVALDQLEEEAPRARAASLVVSWFGDDLRCGECRVRPAAEERDKITEPLVWSAGGVGREDAALVGRRDGRPVYGGTPSDASVIAAIREMRGRGMDVMFYPFVLMDIAPGNGKPDPYGGAEQAAYPWRGRITLDVAPARPGSVDRTAGAVAQVAAFFGNCRAADFTVAGEAVRYAGPEEWGFRRFILHYAHLCAAAGGVDAFCIGSEMRGVTTIRAGAGVYPAVAAFRRLAAEVRAILPGARIGYAADWSEYFGHQPGDGTGDAVFHLDTLWADPAIDFVGIDNYLPLADWRDGEGHADAGAGSGHSLAYLKGNVEGGEGYDWFYASAEDRRAQRRTPITDGAHGEDWIFRPKDIRNWWARPHHDRVGGVRAASPTAWVPQSKPVWFTEIGCGVVDKGANQPNVFVDPKSSETALPWFSTGAADEAMQRRYLQAHLGYWEDGATNPVSAVYGGPMIDTGRAYVWTWDLRPWPDFPQRRDVWSDGDNHALGHWITGRLGAAGLAEVVAAICAEAGIADPDVSLLQGVVTGYAQERPQTARAALQPLMLAYGFDAVESGGRLRFVPRTGGPAPAVDPAFCVAPEREGEAALTLIRPAGGEAPAAVRFACAAADGAYEAAAAEARAEAAGRIEALEAPLAMDAGQAQAVADRLLAAALATGETARFALPPSAAWLEPGDAVTLPTGLGPRRFRVERVSEGGARRIEARRAEPEGALSPRPERRAAAPALTGREPPEVWAFETPAAEGVLVAAFADPWPGPIAVQRIDADGGLTLAGLIERPATLGRLTAALPPGAVWRWSREGPLAVRLFGGALAARSEAAVLDGANLAAVEGAAGWEVLQFADAALTGPDAWAAAPLLRGRFGTEPQAAAGAPEGARFALLDGAVLAIPAQPGEALRLRVGPAHLPADDPAHRDVAVAVEGAWLRPYAPVRLTAAREAGGLRLAWVRRTRVGGDAWGAVEPPVGEEREAWRVTVRAGGRVLRVEDVATAGFFYPAEAMAADGAAAPFEIGVAQLSAMVGPGPEARISIDE